VKILDGLIGFATSVKYVKQLNQESNTEDMWKVQESGMHCCFMIKSHWLGKVMKNGGSHNLLLSSSEERKCYCVWLFVF